MSDESPKQRYSRRLTALKSERASWETHWKELYEYILPRAPRFLASDTNKGTKRHNTIINGTATLATRILSSGMMAGITSPARPWFRLTLPDWDLAEYGPVKAWLHQAEDRTRLILAQSNVYNGLHSVYTDLAVAGTAALHLEEDSQDVLRAYVLPMGQYYLATNPRRKVDTIYREVSMTVRQVVDMFGLSKVSPTVKQQYEAGTYDAWVSVVHVIEPRPTADSSRGGPGNMPFRSCWFEVSSADADALLRDSGYEEFPVAAPRWAVTGEDVYGSSPGMDALGDVRALQLYEKRKAQAVEKIVNPPMKGPLSLLNQRVSLLPGDFTAVAEGNGQTLAPSISVHPSVIQVAEASIQRHETRINAYFYADLWLMMATREAQGVDTQMTAREVAERHEEKMLQLGPVLERLEDELLKPVVDRAFAMAVRRTLLPPAPREIQGQELTVEYISIMAQAQKMLGVAGVERMASFTGNLAAVRPDVLDCLNFDELMSTYADMLGINPNLLNPEDVIAQIRQGRAQQQQEAMAAQRAATAATAAQGAKTLSETDMEGDSALKRLMGSIGGVAGAAGGATVGRTP